jgi:hypothetical protein
VAQRGAVLAGERGITKDDGRSWTRECPDSKGACDCQYQRGVFGALLAASRYCILSVSRTTTSPLQRRLVDKAVFAYVEWREECSAVWDAYGRWAGAPPRERAHVEVAYRAALDREEAAANAYAKLIARVGELLETGLDHPLQSRGSG